MSWIQSAVLKGEDQIAQIWLACEEYSTTEKARQTAMPEHMSAHGAMEAKWSVVTSTTLYAPGGEKYL